MMEREILGCRVDGPTLREAVDIVADFIREGSPHHVITLNAEIAYRAAREAALRQVINAAHLVTPDGAGIVWASAFLGCPVPERVTGIDLFAALAAEGAKRKWRFYLYGAAPGVAAEAARRLAERFPGLQVVGSSHGYLSGEEEAALVREIKGLRPDILAVALGAPKQELWIAEHLQELGVPVAIGIGGTLDVLAGRVGRAPGWMQRLGLEWFYRLLNEPRRAKRMLALPKFIIAVMGQKFFRHSGKKAGKMTQDGE
ncbi:MAG: N-acetylglucosaminyldiphosphoundecaprenol N-acetyl-beta-D-mannosaminyltransferase [Clostridia bacterium]|nr:N-acetylglucosaminyldiphosphoundecaprenol N-acetyl-beta-D-mannosaminyltransferase [Clostridia bacterium]